MRREFTLTRPDGVQLYARAFEAEQPRAAICVAHGLGEHGERYERFAQAMNAQGFSVYVHDHRGHGRNVARKSQRGIARMAELEADMAAMIAQVKKETGLPVVQFGHSLGGLVGLYTTLHTQPDIVGAIITSPWLELVNAPPKALFSVVSALSPVLAPFSIRNGIPAAALTHDAAVCEAYAADPLNHDRIGLGLAGDANRAAQWVLKHPQALQVPLLLCHGAKDPICSVAGSRAFAKAADVRYVEFPEEFHELHNEPTAADKLFAAEIAFLNEILDA